MHEPFGSIDRDAAFGAPHDQPCQATRPGRLLTAAPKPARWPCAGTTPHLRRGPRHICPRDCAGTGCVRVRSKCGTPPCGRATRATGPTDHNGAGPTNAARTRKKPAEKPVCSCCALDLPGSTRSLIRPLTPAPARQTLGIGRHAPSFRRRPLDDDRRQRRRRRARVQHGAGPRGLGARDGVDVRGQRRRRRPVAAQTDRPTAGAPCACVARRRT